MSEARPPINESLDFDAVLDNARSLTGTSYGAFILLDDSGEIWDFLSSELTEEEVEQMWALSDGLRFFEYLYLSRTEEPLRMPDLISHIRSQGLPDLRPLVEVGPSLSFLASPVLYMGKRVGNIFVAKREMGRRSSGGALDGRGAERCRDSAGLGGLHPDARRKERDRASVRYSHPHPSLERTSHGIDCLRSPEGSVAHRGGRVHLAT